MLQITFGYADFDSFNNAHQEYGEYLNRFIINVLLALIIDYCYLILSAILLINLLIAMLTDVYSYTIHDNARQTLDIAEFVLEFVPHKAKLQWPRCCQEKLERA
jgi:hypothetical protein